MKNKGKLFKIVIIVQVVVLISALGISYFFEDFINYNNTTTHSNIGEMSTYLRFMMKTKIQTILVIALHNFVLSLVSYIFSFLTLGVWGCFSLFLSFLGVGFALKNSKDAYSVVYIILEMCGMYLPVVVGTYLSFKRKCTNYISLKKIFLLSILLCVFLIVLYIIAAYIESMVLYNL